MTVPPCEICSTARWETAYSGPVRNGPFGKVVDGVVHRCGECGVERLQEEYCLQENFYRSNAYRSHVDQEAETRAYQQQHDALQRFGLEALGLTALRNLTVADVGCAGGSFLDHISGLAGKLIGIEPCVNFHDDLQQRGYQVFPFSREAQAVYGTVDLAASFQVIEHCSDPVAFLTEIRPLLAPGGRLIISTPNLNDALCAMVPEYLAFFYRVAHRWYFNSASIAACAERAGYEIVEIRYVHRYSLSNFLLWLRDKRPQGGVGLPGIDHMADLFWKGYLENSGRADTLFATMKPKT